MKRSLCHGPTRTLNAIEALVISNTTARDIDARNQLAVKYNYDCDYVL